MKTVRGDSVKVQCWHEYSWDPDCLGCWVLYCPRHLTFARGTGEEMLAALKKHLRESHPAAPAVLH